jgi:dienelactone hydrolase
MLGSRADAQPGVDAFDGSFQLDTGEVVTGGYFVEDGQGHFLYLDTRGLKKGGLFQRVGDTVLRSVIPPGAIEVDFNAGPDGALDSLVWKQQGQEPVHGVRIDPHDNRSIEFESEDGTVLHGRLLVPRCAGPHPAVVYIQGSGPVDRHNGPFQTFLLQQGVAVLSYDKRGYTTDKDAWHEPDLSQLAADAAAAVRFLATQPGIDAHRIGIFGVSQAGWIAPAAAVEAKGVAFLILRAGAAVSEFETHTHESRQEFRADGLHGLDLDYAVALEREIYRLAMDGQSIAATDHLVAPYVDTSWYKTAFGDGPVSETWSAGWWSWAQRNFAFSATPYLERFDGSVLWFLGGKDENVPLIPTRAALERAFAAAPGDDHEIDVIKDAPHSFLIPGPNGLPHFAPGFFSRINEWLSEHRFSDAKCWSAE